MTASLYPVAALAATLILGGCKSALPEQDEESPRPPSVAFTGVVDEMFVGDWKSTNGMSGLDLFKDGHVNIFSGTPSPKGIVKTTIKGHWLVSGGSLVLRYPQPDRTDTTIKYIAALKGNSLTLSQSAGRLKTVYRRK